MASVPRPRGDHDARRGDVARAVLRVVAANGFLGLTIRAVASELGASTGVVTHYFASKDELQKFALDLLARTVEERHRSTAEPGIATLRTLLHGMLPISDGAASATRIWISSWDVVLADAQLTATHAKSYADSRARLEEAIRVAQQHGDLIAADPGELAASLQSFTLGLSVQAILDPGEFPGERQIALIDAYLCKLSPPRQSTEQRSLQGS